MSEIDNFVAFLISNICEGCKQCNPMLPSEMMPDNLVCVEEGRAKWLLAMAREYKKEVNHDIIL